MGFKTTQILWGNWKDEEMLINWILIINFIMHMKVV